MRNVTRAKMPNLGVAICVPELLLSHLPKFIEFYLCIQVLPSKM